MGMIKLVGTWNIPVGADAEAVDKHYFDVHVPNARSLPRCRRHVALKGVLDGEGRYPAFHRGAEVWFDNREDFDAAIASPEWQDNVMKDGFVENVSGLEIVVYDVEEVWEP
jgi:uncharacterized protein (TIGR02118 family)